MMTEREMRFAEEWVKDCNGVRAYMAAYPSIKNKNSARSLACKLLAKVDVKSYIDELLEKMRSERIADDIEVLEYLTKVLRGESQSEIVVVEGLGEGISEARKFSKNPDERERLKAAELLGKVSIIRQCTRIADVRRPYRPNLLIVGRETL